MNTTQRRTHILDYLKQADRPLSATALARRLSVSRQIIVGDVALLRAAGEPISATPRGYVLERPRPGLSRTVACLHSGVDMERELTLMVDQGCTVENVIVEHPVYGQITGPLELSSRYDISEGGGTRRPAPVAAHRRHPPAHPALPRRGRFPAGGGGAGPGRVPGPLGPIWPGTPSRCGGRW